MLMKTLPYRANWQAPSQKCGQESGFEHRELLACVVNNIEKGILRRAFAHVLPHDVLYRKKSAYPSAQHPTYDKAIRKWALHILDTPNAPIQPLIKPPVVRAWLEQADFGVVPFAERFIHLNAWLDKYQITLAL